MLLTVITPTSAAAGAGEGNGGLQLGEELRDFILGVHHPFVMPVLDVLFLTETVVALPVGRSLGIFRAMAQRGSLKDVLHAGVDAALPAAEKYQASRRGGRRGGGLARERLLLYGRQILEGVCYLEALGLSCASLHCGNVLVLGDDWVALSDWENDVVGLPSLDRQHDWQIRRPNPATYAFGHVLYEMASGGAPLTTNSLPPNVAQRLQEPMPPPPPEGHASAAAAAAAAAREAAAASWAFELAQLLDVIFNQPCGDQYSPLTVPQLLQLPLFGSGSAHAADAPALRPRHERLLAVPSATVKELRRRLAVATGGGDQEGEAGGGGGSRSRGGRRSHADEQRQAVERAARQHVRQHGEASRAARRAEKAGRREQRDARRARRARREAQRRGLAAEQEARRHAAAAVGGRLHLAEFDTSQPLGLELGTAPLAQQGAGVVVTAVHPGGQALQLGLEPGMVLRRVGGVTLHAGLGAIDDEGKPPSDAQADPSAAATKSALGTVLDMVSVARQAGPSLRMELETPALPLPEECVLELEPGRELVGWPVNSAQIRRLRRRPF
jgi:hypothetical protein